jgi:hypothetical protein
MKKLTKEEWKSVRVTNSHNLCTLGGGDLFISYGTRVTGRGGSPPKWQVIGITKKTDPTAPWYDYGQKTWNIFDYTKKATLLAEAKEWVAQTYGIKEWVRDVFGDWQAAEVYAKADVRARELLEEKK